jgi:hypothetical protein
LGATASTAYTELIRNSRISFSLHGHIQLMLEHARSLTAKKTPAKLQLADYVMNPANGKIGEPSFLTGSLPKARIEKI